MIDTTEAGNIIKYVSVNYNIHRSFLINVAFDDSVGVLIITKIYDNVPSFKYYGLTEIVDYFNAIRDTLDR